MNKIISIFFAIIAIGVVCPGQNSEPYVLGPDSKRQENVPKGTVEQFEWESTIYANTWREYFVYVPAQYQPKNPAALMVFQDGHAYLNEEDNLRTTIVFDNLIHKNQVPVTICIFVNPGHSKDLGKPSSPWRANNRSFEYDDMSDQYATFLIDEIIAEVAKKYNISDDPKMHAIGGLSSGGICAFTAAWFRPDYFHKVLSHIGSFTDIRGGNDYPYLIRKSAKQDIKVFLQDGENDLDLVYGNWWLSNLQMVSALKFKGYDYKFESGTGGHDSKHGGAILPESLIWLWHDVMVQH